MCWRAVTLAGLFSAGVQAQTLFIEDFEAPALSGTFGTVNVDDKVGVFTVMDGGKPVTLMRFDDRPGTNGVQVLGFGRVGDGGGEAGLYTQLSGLRPMEPYMVTLDHSSLALTVDQGMWSLSIKLESGGEFTELGSISGTHLYMPDGDNGYGTREHPWESWQVKFDAPAADAALWIYGAAFGNGHTGAYPVIDNVQVTAIHEPTSEVLLLVAALGLALARFSAAKRQSRED